MSSSPSNIVLVTGASGFLGSHIVEQLLKSGLSVRALVRSNKVDLTLDGYAQYGPNYQVFGVEDIAYSDLSEALHDIRSVIHVASPLPAKGTAREVIRGAVEGTVNVLRQAYDLGITKFIVTGSSGAVLGPNEDRLFTGESLGPDDWTDVTIAQAIDGTRDPMYIYGAAKTLAERAAWDLADQHPDIDLCTIIPPRLHGPFASGQPIHTTSDLSTNVMILALISGPGGRPLPPAPSRPLFCDVRDVARAHVRALQCPPQKFKKRILLYGGSFTQVDAVRHIYNAHPILRERLPDVNGIDPSLDRLSVFDTKRARELLNLTEMITWQDSVDETIEDLSRIQERRSLSDTKWGDWFLSKQATNAETLVQTTLNAIDSPDKEGSFVPALSWSICHTT